MHKGYLTHTFKQSWLSVVALAICLVLLKDVLSTMSR